MNIVNHYIDDIITAINAYAAGRAGSVEDLPDHRRTPCYQLLTYLRLARHKHWKEIKSHVIKELGNLKKGLLGRSELRDKVMAVLNHPAYSNDNFYEAEIAALKDKIASLEQQIRSYQTHKIISEYNATIFSLRKTNQNREDEYRVLKDQYDLLLEELTDLQNVKQYGERKSLTSILGNKYEKFSVDDKPSDYSLASENHPIQREKSEKISHITSKLLLLNNKAKSQSSSVETPPSTESTMANKR